MSLKRFVPDKCQYEAPSSAVVHIQASQLVCTSNVEETASTDPFIIDDVFDWNLL